MSNCKELQDFTFNKVTDECAQVVRLLLLSLTDLHHIRQILTDLLQQLATHLHLAFKEPEQWVLNCLDKTKSNPMQTLGRCINDTKKITNLSAYFF